MLGESDPTAVAMFQRIRYLCVVIFAFLEKSIEAGVGKPSISKSNEKEGPFKMHISSWKD